MMARALDLPAIVASSQERLVDPQLRLGRTLRRSRLVLALLGIGLGLPLALVPISGAVIAQGEVSVATQVKKIAHPRGGVISELRVSNGDRVRTGDLLMRLDSNVSGASATMTARSIEQLLAKEARLRAERDGSPAIGFPPALTSRIAEPEVARAMEEERRIFSLNRSTLVGQQTAIEQQIRQAGNARVSYMVQADAFRQQEGLIAEERAANEQLWQKRYTTLQRRNELIRAAVSLRGSVATSEASAAQMTAKIAELRENILVLGDRSRRDAGRELAEVQSRLIELRQNDVVAQDANARNTIRAPSGGIVSKLAFTTIGGVLPAGEIIMEIVPDRDRLIVTARVSPGDIDQLTPGGEVSLRFVAFNQSTTPQIAGRLAKVGADRTVDEQRGIAYYPVEIEISRGELAKAGNLSLRSGMPVEAFIKTGERSLLAYLFRPLSDQIARAFR